MNDFKLLFESIELLPDKKTKLIFIEREIFNKNKNYNSFYIKAKLVNNTPELFYNFLKNYEK